MHSNQKNQAIVKMSGFTMGRIDLATRHEFNMSMQEGIVPLEGSKHYSFTKKKVQETSL